MHGADVEVNHLKLGVERSFIKRAGKPESCAVDKHLHIVAGKPLVQRTAGGFVGEVCRINGNIRARKLIFQFIEQVFAPGNEDKPVSPRGENSGNLPPYARTCSGYNSFHL